MLGVWRPLLSLALSLAESPIATWAISVAEIQGKSFRSPYEGQTVNEVYGILTAKDNYGGWISDVPSSDPRESNGLRIYGPHALRGVSVGDDISLTGRVAEYRSSPNDLSLTELDLIRDIIIFSHDNPVKPVLLGEERTPPKGQLSRYDDGPDGSGWLAIPNNVTRVEEENDALRPELYGLDFWESLEGQLVTVPSPVAANFPDRYGAVWVYGAWPVSGLNSRGGLTVHFPESEGPPDAHSGAILIGRPLDNTKLPRAYMGMEMSDITGVVTYQFGDYYILPLTAPEVIWTPDERPSPATLRSGLSPCSLTIGDYNVENMGPRSWHLPTIADHIVSYLNAPDIVFLQEIQDDSGRKDDGTVSADKTLSRLTAAIARVSLYEAQYEYAYVAPEDGMDGGQPGGNIRVAYLWRPEKVTLVSGSHAGNATQATEPVLDEEGKVTLRLNPGRIDPTNAAWEEARKPVAAAWQTNTGERFYTVNVHYSSKRDSSSAQGDARPPVNGKSEQRMAQVNVTAAFVSSLLALDPSAHIIVGGDMNEFLQTRSVFAPFDGLLTDMNEVAGVPPAERYTYVYEQHAQEIDHVLVSDAVKAKGGAVEHVHINTWATSKGGQASDHDPTVAKVWVCEAEGGEGSQYNDDPESVVVQAPWNQVVVL
ncbi:DNase I-like protein [Rhodofomes roseus]|uniref:DNase I-like protein n=1 Tax=Rhodofomes roseus TaxID=34475 RepID=A0ABQ8KJV3_9APHY|nr:DNase I-like protein [Rhodofomes roseus]KAH9838400.1 DNase I-like protein [Rhodofomes roseus]